MSDDLTVPDGDRLLAAKELAFELGRDVTYIYAMKRDGFVMPAGLSTLNHALKWLAKHPPPRRRGATENKR